MKSTFTFFVLFFFALATAWSQNPRLVLAEGFSSATCGPCAAQNPAWNALLHANEDIVTSVKYQMNWPSPGNDPMYHHNPTDNGARRNYYSVNSVPQAVIQGNHYQGPPNQVSQTMLENLAAQTSPFQIQLQHQLNEAQDSIFLTMLIKADAPVSGNLVAHIAVIEKHIHFTNPPGTNGERDFYNIMKALLPNRHGTSLAAFEPGDYVIIEAAWELQNVYDIGELAAVGFIQDNDNKDIHQAANSSTEPIIPHYANDAAVTSISDYAKTNCSGLMKPTIKITNHGSEPLTTADYTISINGIEAYTNSWTGQLDFLESAFISTEELVFEVLSQNELSFEITATNGQADDYPANTNRTVIINGAPNTEDQLTLMIFPDNNPEEISWEVLNSAGTVVASGGPYSSTSAITEHINLTEIDCYEFVMYDAGGNGLCCAHGTGFYGLLDAGNNTLFTGSEYAYKDRHEFGFGLVGTPEKGLTDFIRISPNPAKSAATTHIRLSNAQEVSISLYDSRGSQLHKQHYGKLQAGEHTFTEGFENLPNGFYLVAIQIGGEIHSLKLLVQ